MQLLLQKLKGWLYINICGLHLQYQTFQHGLKSWNLLSECVKKCSCSPFILLDVRLEGDLKFSEFYMDFISLSASAGFTDLSLLWCSLVSVLAIQSSCFLWDHIKLLNNTPRATTAIHLLKKVFHFNKKVKHYQKHLQRNHQESHNEGRDSLCFAVIWLFFMQKTLMTTWIRSKKETTANFNA